MFFTLEQLFSTAFGRRLGTETDGSTLRSNSRAGVEAADIDTALAATTRDVTLKQAITVKLVGDGADLDFNVSNTQQTIGYAYAGPRLKTAFQFNTTWFDGPFNSKSSGAFISSAAPISHWGDARVVSNRALTIAELTNAYEKVRNVSITNAASDTSPYIKWNIAYPTQIKTTAIDFSQTSLSFDTTNETFDRN